jgi:hypothetical protein
MRDARVPVSRWFHGLLLCALLVWVDARAEKAIVIGGGPSLSESQGQIEQNVLWLQRLLPGLGYDVDMYFGIGNEPGDDVVFSSHDEAAVADPYYALDLVFTDPGAMPVGFKRHDVADVLGSTRKEELTPAVDRTLRELAPGDSLLLVFNGHGGEGGSSDDDNTMDLWGPSEMTVAELDRLLDAAPDDATIRFVMPQCFSGGFASLMYRPPGTRRLSTQNRCGFLSQEARRSAEGCQLGIEDVEYRDYTTYLFAALGGRARNGEPLSIDPDRDGSGTVSFREAHWYALRTALSYDLSRSTSEVFLEDWEPRRLRKVDVDPLPASVYLDIAAEVARRHGWALAPDALVATLDALKAQTKDRLEAKEAIGKRIEAAQRPLQKQLRSRWPFLKAEYDSIDWAAHETAVEEVDGYLRAQPGFSEILALTKAHAVAESAELEAERLKTQVEKVQRMLRLARLEALFAVHASPEERRQYERLVGCEDGVPPARR